MSSQKAWLPVAFIAGAATLLAQGQNPLLPENAVTRVSDHVYAIMGFPNVGIVVGSKATLIVDTGMGPRNGTTIAREAAKLSGNRALYVTTTHFHPEHASGIQGFPAQTILIRPAVQQEEMERRGNQFLDLFRSRSALNKELLADVQPRTPDIVFDSELKLDLGGITARLMWLGAAHTKGDELIFVEPDSVLISGDIVQNKIVPSMPNEDSSLKSWLAILDRLEPLKPRAILPDHGTYGEASLIGMQRAFMKDMQGRALELKRKGTAVEEAGKLLASELKARYPDWTNPNNILNLVRRVYAESE